MVNHSAQFLRFGSTSKNSGFGLVNVWQKFQIQSFPFLLDRRSIIILIYIDHVSYICVDKLGVDTFFELWTEVLIVW